MERTYKFIANDTECIAHFKEHDTIIAVPSKKIAMYFSKFKIFKQTNQPVEVGIQIEDYTEKKLPYKSVYIEQFGTRIAIGCFDFTKEEFNKLYKLINYKSHE